MSAAGSARQSWCHLHRNIELHRPDSIPMLQVRIVKEDGAVGLFRGAGPTVVRAMALNMGMLASNDEASSHSLRKAKLIHTISLRPAMAGLLGPQVLQYVEPALSCARPDDCLVWKPMPPESRLGADLVDRLTICMRL